MTTHISHSQKLDPYLPYALVILGLSTPLIQMMLGPILENNVPFPMNRFLSLWIFWIIVGIVLFTSVKLEGIPLSTFGIQSNTRSLRYRLIEMIVAILIGTTIMVILTLFSLGMREILSNTSEVPQLNLDNILPFWVMFPAWITASFTEELLFRAYPIERLNLLTGKPMLAGFISALLFTGLHFYGWDWIHLLTFILPGSFIITGIYLWRRSLWFVVIIHATINLPLLLLPLIAPFL